ncbi:aminotransferase class I/II-fold pyridoxal phosphate-dependent enzyme, partial [Desulfothermus okinawensis]
MDNQIFLSPPYQSGKELKYIKKVLDTNYLAPVGEFIDRFEKAVCEYTGAKYAVAVSSGTAAIHLALRTLGIGKGDYVLASTFTFIGSVVPILYQNAIPIFVDSDYETWNIDPNLLEDAIIDLKQKKIKPKALILTHIYGQSSDMDSIIEICEKYGIILIEDAAESLGATYKEKYTGTFGKAGIYSFNGNKIITTSGGGMLVTDDEETAKNARFYSTQAKENKIWYEHKEYGYNYRMSNLLAAVGLAQLENIDYRVQKRRKIFQRYKDLLSDVDEIEFMPELHGAKGNRWLTTITFKKSDPFEIVKKTREANIET